MGKRPNQLRSNGGSSFRFAVHAGECTSTDVATYNGGSGGSNVRKAEHVSFGIPILLMLKIMPSLKGWRLCLQNSHTQICYFTVVVPARPRRTFSTRKSNGVAFYEQLIFTSPSRFVCTYRRHRRSSIYTIHHNPPPPSKPHASIYLLNPLNLSFALSNTSSSLHTANRSQSSTICAFASVKNSVGGIAATPSSLMQNQLSLKSRGRLATCGGKG